jgi:hypothetical protein
VLSSGELIHGLDREAFDAVPGAGVTVRYGFGGPVFVEEDGGWGECCGVFGGALCGYECGAGFVAECCFSELGHDALGVPAWAVFVDDLAEVLGLCGGEFEWHRVFLALRFLMMMKNLNWF